MSGIADAATHKSICCIATALFLITGGCAGNQPAPAEKEEYRTWTVRGGSSASIRYSRLDQVDAENVGQLEVAWEYKTGDLDPSSNTEMQTNAIIVDQTLYGASPRLNIIALDAATGEEKWVHNPNADTTQAAYRHRNRGVVYWEDGDDKRILFTAGPYLHAIRAQDGTLIEEFGEGGKTSFTQGLGDRDNLSLMSTSPGIIYKDLIISGSTPRRHTPGHIRAFNVRTGELAWVFHTIPQPGEFGYDTWEDPDAWKEFGHANAWAGLSLDEERGIVFAPTGSASSDFYGGYRKGSNLFANTLLALDASTGERIWHFQTVRHDLWDYDLPAQPSLVSVIRDGEQIDAVSQTTKTGFVFLFDRETGEPLFPIEDRPVPVETELKGESVWPSQPYPLLPEPFARQSMSEDDINPYVSDEVQELIREQFKNLKSDHMFDPPSLGGTLVFPGFDGGAEWGGTAFDPETGILYVNSNDIPWTMTMIPAAGGESTTELVSTVALSPLDEGREVYMRSCVACHGPDRTGGGSNPSLINIEERYSPEAVLEVINSGRGMMPGFNHLPDHDKTALVNYLTGEEHFTAEKPAEENVVVHSVENPPYLFTGHRKFRTPEGYPASSPPWGTLNAIDLNTGDYVWRIPLGEYPDLKERGIPPTGTENYGGPVVTAGGLVFIAATLDEKIRAFDKSTGELLWEHDLPAAGYATPSIYEIGGKQFIVIACGGGKLGTASGDSYVAFSLP